jgi:toxin ParE1/3/4
VKVEWLPRALNNLRDQVVYVGQRNLPAARELASAVKAAAGEIAKFPYSGRKGRVPGTRELVVSRTAWSSSIASSKMRGEHPRASRGEQVALGQSSS